MSPAAIAVVIPLHNKAPHVARLMASLAAQTRPPDEVIVIDDASTDGGAQAVAAFGWPGLRLLRRDIPGPGGYAARNMGARAARSDWIAFLDADDSWRPHALAEVERLIGLADDRVSCVFTNYDRDYGQGPVPSSAFGALARAGTSRLDFIRFIEAWLATGQSPMWTSAVVARRSGLLEAGLFPEQECRRGGDKDTWLRLLTVGDALCSGEVTATYHRDAVNMVTRQVGTNHRPYLCSTLEALFPGLEPAAARLAERLINLEIDSHAREAWRHGLRVPQDLYRGYRAWRAPLGYGVVWSLAHAPAGVLDVSYRLRATLVGLRHGRSR